MPPSSTYRLQLRREFGFRDAAAVVPYLADLGVSHVYCSPVLQATPGSAHGYDVVDHRRLSDELGGDAAWADLVMACRQYGLGLVVDVVPNHMAVPVPETLNAALWDMLRLGRASAYAHWFDVDWDAQDGRILMPVLGRPLDECLAAGEVVVDQAAGVVRYYDHSFPLAPGTDSLDEQHYRLVHWRAGGTELNYRRFFDVTSLIGVRVEIPDVFDATHERLLALVRAGDVDGLRIDHPDGLADPAGYLGRLAGATGGAWTTVEKILEGDEVLPASWRCAGTTGYDAVRAVTQVLLDPAGEQPMTEIYASLAGMAASFDEVVDDSKRLVVDHILGAEVTRLVNDLGRLQDQRATAFARAVLREAVAALLVSFDVYRAYAGDPASQHRIDVAAARATSGHPHLADAIGWIASLLRRTDTDAPTAAFTVRFEQTTGPVTAKGVEDTAFYRYHRLVALNEVGGDPGTFGRPLSAWHEHCLRMQRDWPASMTTLSTHDTKRSEDVRARLLTLAEVPATWATAVTRWRRTAAGYRPPDANTDYLFWQTLVGAWPLSLDRMLGYMEKATREAKQHTSWTDSDPAYDTALREYVRRVYGDLALMDDVGRFVEQELMHAGRSNSLAQKLLQLTMPGVPDVYQGQELTEHTLVDPDNRRPVDYAARARMLEELDATTADPTLLVSARVLRLRRARPDVFSGDYAPMRVSGVAADHAVAFLRGGAALTVATRLPVTLRRSGGWRETAMELPPGEWRDTLTGSPVDSGRLAKVLSRLPVALLVRADG